MSNVHLHPVMAERHSLAKSLLELAKLARDGRLTKIVFAAVGEDPSESGYWIGALDSGSDNPFVHLGLSTALNNYVSQITRYDGGN